MVLLFDTNLHSDFTTYAHLFLSWALLNNQFSCPKTVADNVPYEWQNWEGKLNKQWKIAVLDDVKKADDMIKETNVTLSSPGELTEISVEWLWLNARVILIFYLFIFKFVYV